MIKTKNLIAKENQNLCKQFITAKLSSITRPSYHQNQGIVTKKTVNRKGEKKKRGGYRKTYIGELHVSPSAQLPNLVRQINNFHIRTPINRIDASFFREERGDLVF